MKGWGGVRRKGGTRTLVSRPSEGRIVFRGLGARTSRSGARLAQVGVSLSRLERATRSSRRRAWRRHRASADRSRLDREEPALACDYRDELGPARVGEGGRGILGAREIKGLSL